MPAFPPRPPDSYGRHNVNLALCEDVDVGLDPPGLGTGQQDRAIVAGGLQRRPYGIVDPALATPGVEVRNVLRRFNEERSENSIAEEAPGGALENPVEYRGFDGEPGVSRGDALCSDTGDDAVATQLLQPSDAEPDVKRPSLGGRGGDQRAGESPMDGGVHNRRAWRRRCAGSECPARSSRRSAGASAQFHRRGAARRYARERGDPGDASV